MAHLFGRQLGSYRLTRLLGHGGSAEVYLGEHIHLGTQAAIKVLLTQLLGQDIEQFRAEARTLAQLIHPHIVRILDFGIEEHTHTPYLVMDYAPNGTLRQRHREGARVPLETILPYIRQIAQALQYAHKARVVHRDIKPENLLLGPRGEVLLSDFGIAIRAHRSISQTPQKILGTARYMAPEQCQGQACKESDQYALAVVVYEWLCGELPFSGDTPFSIALHHMHTPPPPLRARIPWLSPQVEQVVLKALAKDPKNRFLSVQAFAAALEEAYQTQGPPGAVSGRAPVSRPVAMRPFPIPSQPEPAPARPQAAPPTAPPAQAPLAPPEPKDLPAPGSLRGKPLSADPQPAAPLFADSAPARLAPAEPSVSPAQPPAQPLRQTRPRQDRSILGKGGLRYAIGGWGLVLIGIVALALGDWTVGGFAIVIGLMISLAASLLS